jgi:hypothetical protein
MRFRSRRISSTSSKTTRSMRVRRSRAPRSMVSSRSSGRFPVAIICEHMFAYGRRSRPNCQPGDFGILHMGVGAGRFAYKALSAWKRRPVSWDSDASVRSSGRVPMIVTFGMNRLRRQVGQMTGL